MNTTITISLLTGVITIIVIAIINYLFKKKVISILLSILIGLQGGLSILGFYIGKSSNPMDIFWMIPFGLGLSLLPVVYIYKQNNNEDKLMSSPEKRSIRQTIKEEKIV